MLLPPDGPELTREAIEKRLQEIDALPDAGKLATRLREQRGLSQRSLAKAVGVMPRDIMTVEREGRVRVLRDPSLGCSFTLEVPGETPNDAKLNKFLEILAPTPDERAILLQDISGEFEFEKMVLVMESIGMETEEYLAAERTEQSGCVDPWDSEPKPTTRNRRRQRVAAVSPLHAIGSVRVPQGVQGAASVGHTVGASNPSEEAGRQEQPLRYRIQLVAINGDGREEAFEVATLSKKMERPEHVGLTLAESKTLLRHVQRAIVETQIAAYLATRQACERCNKELRRKDYQSMVLRSLFGNVPLVGPRMKSCDCHPAPHATFQPLRDLLPENTTPELLFMESKWASLVSYGLTPKVIKDLLPVDDKLNAQTVRNHTVMVAERCEKDLERSQVDLTDAVEDVQDQAKQPGGSFNVGIDGAYLRLWRQRGRKFEILIGRSVPSVGPTKSFGTVHTVDDDPKRRLRAVLVAQGIQPHRPVRFMADGEDTLRSIQRDLIPDATHILDWFHVTMRLTVLRQYVRGVVKQEKDAETYAKGSVGYSLQKAWTSTKWKLWHGKIDDALERLSTLRQNVLLIPATYPRAEKFLHTVDEFQKYIVNNRDLIINYGEAWRSGRPITTASIESLVCSLIGRRFAKKQQMQWTPKGAHLLLQVRVKVANGDLPSTFQQWYPEFPVADHDARVVVDGDRIAA